VNDSNEAKMTYYQTALYSGKWNEHGYGWDYGELLYESEIHHNPTFVMVKFNKFLHREDKWIATMRTIENDEVVLEEIFDSTVLGKDKYLTVTFEDFTSLNESEKIDEVDKFGVLLGERTDNLVTYKLFQIQAFYVEIKYLEGKCFYDSIRYSSTTELLDPYLDNKNLKSDNLF
jgi:hypothetical protein